jgi:hypothetical protein
MAYASWAYILYDSAKSFRIPYVHLQQTSLRPPNINEFPPPITQTIDYDDIITPLDKKLT